MFFIRLRLPFGVKLKSYFDKLGVQIVEHLKHLEKENWDFVTIEILELKFIQIRQLNTAVDFIKKSGEINLFLGEPIPLIDCEYGKARYIPMEENSEKDTKKKVLFMGDNLDLVTSNFYNKKNYSAQEPIVLDESEDENNDVMISGITDGNDRRSDRMEKCDSKEPTKLDDQATEHQRQQWNK